MKTLALSILLTCLSFTTAFAQDALDIYSPPSASVPAAELPTLQDVTKVANKAGALVGGVFYGTFKVGTALFSGMKNGLTGSPPTEEPAKRSQAKSDSPSLTGLLDIYDAANRVPAPVEDRSTYYSAPVL
jgi:hypothetical protein